MSEQETLVILDRTDRILDAVARACEIIETGDLRLLAQNGPAGGQPPEISLAEWREMYVALDAVRGLGESCPLCGRRWLQHTDAEERSCVEAYDEMEGLADAASY